MTRVVGRWKAWQKRTLHIAWQKNFFDHRIRHDHEFTEKADYIRCNSVAGNLCKEPADWTWVLDLNNSSRWNDTRSAGEDTGAHL
jgi:hypothetical protein